MKKVPFITTFFSLIAEYSKQIEGYSKTNFQLVRFSIHVFFGKASSKSIFELWYWVGNTDG